MKVASKKASQIIVTERGQDEKDTVSLKGVLKDFLKRNFRLTARNPQEVFVKYFLKILYFKTIFCKKPNLNLL